MPVCRRVSVALCVVCALGAAGVLADFRVGEVRVQQTDAGLRLSGTLDLSLNAKVEEALSKGIPLVVSVQIVLYRSRPLLWDPDVQSWVLRRRISYHALSRQYLVSGHRPDPQTMESFTSLPSALANMGSLDDVQLPVAAKLAANQDYYVRLRASLDLEALPAPLRPVAYTSLSWRLNSGWTQWNVQH